MMSINRPKKYIELKIHYKSMADYSNTIIYKITCKNPDIIDTYVGHTIDFVKRCYAHKNSSMNDENKLKLYETIRANGGWNNWKMEIIHHFSCNNANEARIKEQEYYVLLKANLNSVEPHRTHENIEKCIDLEKNVNTMTKNDYSTTYVYEIVCKNENVATKFIGYTTNFTQRKYHHKRNILSNNNNAMYNIISENGGFENWNIRKLQVYKCENVNDARALLNNYTGYIHENERSNNYRCEICDYVCITKGNLNNHYKTKKHLTNEMNKKQGATALRPSALVREGFAPPAHMNAQRSMEENLWFTPPVQPQINKLTQLVIDLTNENSKTQKQIKHIMKSNQELQNIIELYKSVIC